MNRKEEVIMLPVLFNNDKAVKQKQVVDIVTKIDKLQAAVGDFPWQKSWLKEEAAKNISAMQLASELHLGEQIEHHRNYLAQTFFKDFLYLEKGKFGQKAITICPLNNAEVVNGNTIIEFEGSVSKKTVWHLHAVNGEVPIPVKAMQFLKDLVDRPKIRSLVEGVIVVEVKVNREPDPWLVVRAGKQWFRVMKWRDVNSYR